MRHGETDWNLVSKATGAENIPLNDTGRAQARDVAKIVVPFGITRIFASDLARAAETADIIGQELNVTVEYDPRLREWNFGDIKGIKENGLNPESFKSLLIKNQTKDMEPINAVFVRIGEFLDELDMNQNTLIVSHGGLMRAMMYYLETGDKDDIDAFIKFGFSKHVDNAQIFAFRNKKFEILCDQIQNINRIRN